MKFIYTYYGQTISLDQFKKNVPDDWKDNIEKGTFSYGGYKAVQI